MRVKPLFNQQSMVTFIPTMLGPDQCGKSDTFLGQGFIPWKW
jgi:hypothetical protein